MSTVSTTDPYSRVPTEYTTAGRNSATAGSDGKSAGDLRSSYMTLLITQLQNQNPLDPMDNNQMSSQLAQLSQLEQLEGMNKNFSKVLLSSQVQQATGMIGKDVTFYSDEFDEPLTGKVSKFAIFDNQVLLQVGDFAVPLEQVVTVTNG